MELYQLKTFARVAEEGNLTRAAELLFTSQPAISAQIKALEEELGVALFDRSSRGMQLTAKGELLYAQAVETLNAAAKLRSDAQQLQQELVGGVKIGVHTDFDFMRIGALHRLLAQHHPRVAPHFMAGMSATILPDIRRGVLDAGFFFGPCSLADLAITHLLDVPIQVVGPADWADRIDGASMADLVQLPWVYTSHDCPFYSLSQTLFAEHGSEPARVAYVDTEDAVRALIRAGAGISLLRADDASRMQDAGEAVCWQGASLRMPLSFAVQRQRAGEPLIRATRKLVAENWGESAELADRVEA